MAIFGGSWMEDFKPPTDHELAEEARKSAARRYELLHEHEISYIEFLLDPEKWRTEPDGKLVVKNRDEPLPGPPAVLPAWKLPGLGLCSIRSPQPWARPGMGLKRG